MCIMSYTIEYNRQFIKTKNGYIPCWMAGDNNVTTGCGKYEKRARDWSIFHNWLDVTEEFMLEQVKGMYNEWNQHWKKGSNWVTNEGLSRWIKNGCKQAGTVEEILEVNPYLRGITCYISYYDKDDVRKQELYSVISTNKGLEEWINKAKSFMRSCKENGLKYVYPMIDLEREDLKHPKNLVTSREYEENAKFVLQRKGKYLCEVTDKTSKWTCDIKEATVFTYGEILRTREELAGTYIGSTFSESKLVPASKIDSKRFVLKFADGYYQGQYIGLSAGRGKISLSNTQQGAKVFSSQKAAEKAIEERYWGIKKYGTLVVEDF